MARSVKQRVFRPRGGGAKICLGPLEEKSTLASIDDIREKVRGGEYEFAIPHFFEEMANDGLLFADIERVVATGRIRRRFRRDLRGIRYEIVGTATDRREIAVICRLKETGKLLFITAYALE